MHLPPFRLRFTVRSLMIAVATVGVLMGGTLWIAEMRSRSLAYRIRASQFLNMSHNWLGKGGASKNGAHINLWLNENDYIRQVWSREMAEKYWQLTLRPWLHVEPDLPPEPLAHPRSAVDCPNELVRPDTRRYWHLEAVFKGVFPWWTFPWTCGQPRLSLSQPRWTFP